MEREPYTRLRCAECGAIVEPDRLVADALTLAVFPERAERKYHMRSVNVGSGRPGVFGSRMERHSCGPVREETVSVQEQFVEWLEGRGT